MSYVYAAPPVPPPVPVSAWRGLTVTWTGWDGSVWELSNPNSGVFLQRDGVEGLNMPSHTAWVGSSPAVHGQFYRGHSVDPRELFWPVFVYSNESSVEWLERDRAFWRSLQPGKQGVWTVHTPDGFSRSVSARLVDDGGHSYGFDPVLKGWASYGVTLVADDPFWFGEPHRRSWAQSETQNFYGGGALLGPPFYIASASQLDTAKLTNPGDVEAWPVWTGKGPFTSLTVGVGDSTVSAPFEALAGQVLVINTDPTVQIAWLVTLDSVEQSIADAEGLTGMALVERFGGADVTEQLGEDDFAPIPAGEDRELSLAMAGTGSVEALVHPRFYKAW